jgi:hypothetical protein
MMCSREQRLEQEVADYLNLKVDSPEIRTFIHNSIHSGRGFAIVLIEKLMKREAELNNREPPKYEFNHHHLSQIFMNSSALTSTLCDNMARQAIEYVEEIIYGK